MRLIVSIEEYYRSKSPKTLDDLIDAGPAQWRATCPFCKNPNQKFYVHKEKGLYKCFHCPAQGTLIKYHAEIKGISVEEAFEELADIHERGRKESSIVPSQLVDKYHFDLLKNPLALAELKKQWSIDEEVIKKFKLGVKDNSIAIPISNKRGEWVNIRFRTLFKKDDEKTRVWNFTDPARPNLKFGEARLFPISTVVREDVVFLMAGEKDCISSIRMGIQNAITTTGGEGTFKDDFAFDLAGKTVYIVYDTDVTGLMDSKIVYESLRNIAEPKIINLPKMEDYPNGKPRKDITDYWLLGKTLEDFCSDCGIVLNEKKEFKPRKAYISEAQKRRSELEPVLTEEDKRFLADSRPSFIDDYVDLGSSMVNSPQSYHRLSGLWLASNLLGRNCVHLLDYAEVYPNLFTMILGPTTKFHKTSTTNLAKNILTRVDKEAVAATTMTPQGLMKILEARQETHVASALYLDEIAGMFDLMTADYNKSLRENLIKVHDSEPFVYEKAHDSVRVDSAFVSVIGSGIPSRMAELLSWRDIESGLLVRFLCSLEHDPMPYRERQEMDSLKAAQLVRITKRAKEIREKWATTWSIRLDGDHYLFPNELDKKSKRYVFSFNDAALDRFRAFDRSIEETDYSSEHVGMVHARLPMMCQKLATIYAAVDPYVSVYGNAVDINEEHVLFALRDIERYRPQMIELVYSVGLNQTEKHILSIFEMVYRHPRITRSEIAREIPVNHKELDIIFNTMLDRGLIRMHKLDERTSEFLVAA